MSFAQHLRRINGRQWMTLFTLAIVAVVWTCAVCWLDGEAGQQNAAEARAHGCAVSKDGLTVLCADGKVHGPKPLPL